MGAIGGMLGLNGGVGGTGIAGPQAGDHKGMENLQDTYQKTAAIAAGEGANPAMAQYNQNVQDLSKQQSGALSSVQGISPALATRMISQQGSAAMQNAAAQGATMQAQQQLSALGQMGQIGGAQANAANQMQSNINSSNLGFAQGIMGNQAAAIGGLANGAGGAMTGGAKPAWNGGLIENGPKSHFGKHVAMRAGGKVPGSAPLPGDSPKNDVVDAKLSPGEIVIPRTVVNSKNPSEAAARFVAAVLAKKGKK